MPERPPWLPDPDDEGLVLFGRDEIPEVTDPAPPDGSIEARFRAFHDANPWVYDALHALALDLVRKGKTRIGVGMLWEVVRWQHARATTTDELPRLNNDYRSRYARLLAEREPELADAFETRRLRTA